MNNGNFFNFNAPGYHHYYPPFGAGQQPRQVTNVEVGNHILAGSGQNLPSYPGPSYEARQNDQPGILIDVDEETPNPKQRPVIYNDQSESSSSKISIAVKVINPEKKKETKVFMFHPNPEEIMTPSELREELFQQFGDKIVPSTDDFEIGYYRGQTKLWFELTMIWKMCGIYSVKVVDRCGYME